MRRLIVFLLLLNQWLSVRHSNAKLGSGTFSDETADFLADITGKLDSLDSQRIHNQMVDQLHNEQGQLLRDLANLDELVKDLNRRQVNHLIFMLTKVKDLELARRKACAAMEEAAPVAVTRNEKSLPSKSKQLADLPPAHLQALFNSEVLLNESNARIEKWMLNVLNLKSNEVLKNVQFNYSYVKEFDAAIASLNDTQATSNSTAENRRHKCASSNEAALQVRNAIQQYAGDGIGRFDHARTASIVFERTSETFQAPAQSSQSLGHLWWRRFIPEDWEIALPQGWQEWTFPVLVAHSLGLYRLSGVTPPSAVLQHVDVPGSCWPIKGSSGRVTISLQYPVLVDGITIDHASPRLMMEDKMSKIKSAPKRITVYGYSPCQHSSKCGGLSFNTSQRILLTTIDYNATTGDSRTFDVQPSISHPHPHSLSGNALERPLTTEDGASGSCPAKSATRIAVSGIEVVVHENWGHPEYTCIYRIRVHGHDK